MNRGRPMTHKI